MAGPLTRFPVRVRRRSQRRWLAGALLVALAFGLLLAASTPARPGAAVPTAATTAPTGTGAAGPGWVRVAEPAGVELPKLPNLLPELGNPLSGLGGLRKQVSDAINGWIGSFVSKAVVDPLMSALGKTVLTTPNMTRLPEVRKLWASSMGIAASVYLLVLTVAGVAVMGQDSITSRAEAREYAPRVVAGWLAAACSLAAVSLVIDWSNALTVAMTSTTVPVSGQAVEDLLAGALLAAASGGPFLTIVAIIALGLIGGLVVSAIIRSVLLLVLIVVGPLMLIGHALPWTEPLAHLWWRAVAACAAVQIGQSILLYLGVEVLLAKSSGLSRMFGSGPLMNVFAALALLVAALRLQSWISQLVLRGTGGRSVVATYARVRMMRAAMTAATALL